MNVLLVQAAARFPRAEKAYPLGILYLASEIVRRRAADRVSIHDMQLDTGNVERIVAAVERERPDVLGVSAMTFDSAVLHRLAAEAKRRVPSVRVVAGGSHATCYPDDVLADPNVDFLVHGEGEAASCDLLDALRTGGDARTIPNVGYRENGRARINPDRPFVEDLDTLPFPAFDRIDLEPYFAMPRIGVLYAHRRYATLITSRGCPFRCAYCHRVMGKRHRAHGVDYVLRQMEWLMDRRGVREFVIVDDLFNHPEERAQAIAQGILDRKWKVFLSFPVGLRGDVIGPETLRLLKAAGTYRCMFAFETGSERIQALIDKNLRIPRVLEAVAQAAELGILVNGVFMLGFPTESFQEMKRTVALAVGSRLHSVAFLRVIPFKNTELFDLAVKSGAAVPRDYGDFNLLHTRVNLTDVPEWKIRWLKRWAFVRFYASRRRIRRIWRLLPNRRRMVPMLIGFLFRKALLW